MARTRWPPDPEPRPLAQDGQIGTAPLVGATKPGTRPTNREQDSPRGRQPIRRSGRDPGLRPYARTRSKPRKPGHGPRTIYILPADSVRLGLAFSRKVSCTQNVRF
jgi:hypothetical protein